jgi:hypothetical protein
MTTTEWITDIALLLVVFRQVREGRLTARFVLLPLAIVSVVAIKYLHSIPTAGNDLVLIGTLVAVGAFLGIAGGFYTRVRVVGAEKRAEKGPEKGAEKGAAKRPENGAENGGETTGREVLVKAGVIAAALWVVGMGARMGFQLWSEHGGAASIARFSVTHQITSGQAWVAAFVLMALTEVVTRMGTIVYRGYLARQAAAAPVPAMSA